MFKRILVTLDGSTLSEAALPVAQKLLEGGAAEAVLLTVADMPRGTARRTRGNTRGKPFVVGATGSFGTSVVPPPSPQYAETKDQAVQRRAHELIEYLQRMGGPLAAGGRNVHCAVQFGDAAKEIADFARKGDFDLIVMTTHGTSGRLRDVLQGSVAAEVLRSGVAPVLMVRPQARRRKANPAAAGARGAEGRRKLEAYLRENKVRFKTQKHPEAFTAQEIAASEHVSGKLLAKVVMVVADSRLAMLALPAPRHVDLDMAKATIGARQVRLATEEEFAQAFPDCEVGAMPPFGNMYDVPVYVDESLTKDETIVFNAGTHKETVSLAYADYKELVRPKVGSFAYVP